MAAPGGGFLHFKQLQLKEVTMTNLKHLLDEPGFNRWEYIQASERERQARRRIPCRCGLLVKRNTRCRCGRTEAIQPINGSLFHLNLERRPR